MNSRTKMVAKFADRTKTLLPKRLIVLIATTLLQLDENNNLVPIITPSAAVEQQTKTYGYLGGLMRTPDNNCEVPIRRHSWTPERRRAVVVVGLSPAALSSSSSTRDNSELVSTGMVESCLMEEEVKAFVGKGESRHRVQRGGAY